VNRRRPEGTLPFSSRRRHRSMPGLASHTVGRGELIINNDGWELAIPLVKTPYGGYKVRRRKSR
jgi:hypothetical protein